MKVVEVEAKFFFAVLGVEGGGATHRHCRQQDERHLRTIGQHDGDSVIGSQSRTSQLRREAFYFLAQRRVIERDSLCGKQRAPEGVRR